MTWVIVVVDVALEEVALLNPVLLPFNVTVVVEKTKAVAMLLLSTLVLAALPTEPQLDILLCLSKAATIAVSTGSPGTLFSTSTL